VFPRLESIKTIRLHFLYQLKKNTCASYRNKFIFWISKYRTKLHRTPLEHIS